jgi:hypothetical protein
MNGGETLNLQRTTTWICYLRRWPQFSLPYDYESRDALFNAINKWAATRDTHLQLASLRPGGMADE